MRIIFVIATLALFIAKVKCHGGLAVPFMWTDELEQGDSQTPNFGGNGCTSKALTPIPNPPDGKTKRRLSRPNCYFLVSDSYLPQEKLENYLYFAKNLKHI